jgi:hypothetical protein
MRGWLGLMAIFSLASLVTAQTELTETYIHPEAFAIDYPAGWQVETDAATGYVMLTQGEVSVTLYSPASLRESGLENYNPATLLRLLMALNDVASGEVEIIEPDGARLAYTRGEDAGLLIARTFADDTVGVMDAFGTAEALREHEQTLLLMATTFDVPPVPAPEMLADYAGSWPETIAELESSGLIPTGGVIVFAERYTFASGSSRIQPLAQTVSIADSIMTGSLRLTPSADAQGDVCALLAQVNGDDALEVGVNHDGQLYMADMSNLRVLRDNVDITRQQRVLLLVMDERLLVYLDGILIADEEIEPASGHFGVKVQGGAGTICEATDLWVYRVPTVEPGTCEILATGGAVNKRTGPGTGFEIGGVQEAGANQPALTQATDAEGLIWWQLDDGNWDREDVVEEQGNCRSLPSG